MNISLEQAEQIQNDLITHLDRYPEDLIDDLCQTVVDYRNNDKNPNKWIKDLCNKNPKEPIIALVYTRDCMESSCPLDISQWKKLVKATESMSFPSVYETLDSVAEEIIND